MRLVHLSDIHLSGYDAKWEPNEDQRRELVRDLTELVAVGGPVDGILVGGDIAKSAQPHQYEAAHSFLKQICEAGQCAPERVWVVPGNHDIDRGIHWKPPLRPYLHELVLSAVRTADAARVNKILHDWFLADDGGERLFDSLGAYNDFASSYGCPTSASSPHWLDLTLDLDGLEVQLTGLNSVLVSDTDDTANRPSLVLGVRQCEFERSEGRIHIAFAHHPPDWLGDWDTVRPYLLSRTHLVLFGHEHKYSTDQPTSDGTVIVFAGAVGPEPGGGDDYVPSWNLITLARCDPRIGVTIEPRVWSTALTRFVAHSDGTTQTTVRIDLGDGQIDASASVPEVDAPEVTSANPLLPSPGDVAGGEDLPPSRERDLARILAVRFRQLTRSKQRKIADELGLGAGLDEISPRAVGNEILERVRHANLIDQLQEAVENV